MILATSSYTEVLELLWILIISMASFFFFFAGGLKKKKNIKIYPSCALMNTSVRYARLFAFDVTIRPNALERNHLLVLFCPFSSFLNSCRLRARIFSYISICVTTPPLNRFSLSSRSYSVSRISKKGGNKNRPTKKNETNQM